jgi:hypothetical protein
MSTVMLSGKEPTTGEVVHGRPGVPAWNEHALPFSSVSLPTDCDPGERHSHLRVRGVVERTSGGPIRVGSGRFRRLSGPDEALDGNVAEAAPA